MDTPVKYQIKVQGRINERWSEWFGGFDLSPQTGDSGEAVTLLSGPVADQAALRGILTKLWDLNLNLISVNRIQDIK